MKLYLISRNVNGYDEYGALVIAAKSRASARKIAENESADFKETGVDIEFIGTAKRSIKEGIICVDFNAG